MDFSPRVMHQVHEVVPKGTFRCKTKSKAPLPIVLFVPFHSLDFHPETKQAFPRRYPQLGGPCHKLLLDLC